MLIEQLVQIRKEKGIKQKELAARVGISTSYLCQIEKQRQKPNYELVEEIIEALEHRLILVRYE